jgi:hypothetical protein
MNSTAKSGLDFQDLARGGERNYSCSFLVNLDCDLLALASPDRPFLGAAGEVLAAHATRILDQLTSRSPPFTVGLCVSGCRLPPCT